MPRIRIVGDMKNTDIPDYVAEALSGSEMLASDPFFIGLIPDSQPDKIIKLKVYEVSYKIVLEVLHKKNKKAYEWVRNHQVSDSLYLSVEDCEEIHIYLAS